MKKKLTLSLIAMMLTFAVISGCGKKNVVEETPATTEVAETNTISEGNESIDVEQTAETETTPAVTPVADDAIYVKTAEELLGAIGSNKNIVLEKGIYNLSGVIRNPGKIDNKDIFLVGASMDSEIIIGEISNLSITGPADGVAEIVIEDPYAAVLTFEFCDNISISNVTMGHTVEKGHCSGPVIRLEDCTNVSINKDDLYGCGTYGLECNRSQGIRVNDTTIRECSYGIVSLSLCSDTEFNNCVLKECEYLDLIDVRTSSVVFNNCEFKDNKTDYEFVAKNSFSSVIFNGCSFGEFETERINEQNGGCGTLIFDDKCTFAGNNLKPVIKVSSAKELLDAIRPGATIYIEPGEYNLTECAERIFYERGNVWDRTHEYVKFSEEYDGVEISLNNVSDLTIYGLGESREDVRLLVEPRYAAVFNLIGCSNVTFMNFTAGHTQTGNCVGNVIDIHGGSGFIFNNVDLFGCGVYGIGAQEDYRGIYIYDSIIRDCEYGPFEVSDGEGNIYVVNTKLTGSRGGGTYWGGNYSMYLFRCELGEKESNVLYYIDPNAHVETYCCDFSELTEYPDYEYEEGYEPEWEEYSEEYVPELNKKNIKVIPLDFYSLVDSCYFGYQVEDNTTGDVLMLKGENADPEKFMNIYFYEDGSAGIYGLEGFEGIYTWEVDSSYSAVLKSSDGSREAKITLYCDKSSEEDSEVWMLFSMDNQTVWLY